MHLLLVAPFLFVWVIGWVALRLLFKGLVIVLLAAIDILVGFITRV